MAGFWLIGLPHALFLGTISGALELFPIAGPLSIAFAACGIVNGEQLLVLIEFLVAMRLVQDYLICPRLVGRYVCGKGSQDSVARSEGLTCLKLPHSSPENCMQPSA